MKTSINLNFTLPDYFLEDTLCTALEGGSNYWIKTGVIRKFTVPGDPIPFYKIEGTIIVENDTDEQIHLTKDKALAGLKRTFELRPDLVHDMVTEGIFDAEAADIWLQCTCFNEIRYG